MKVHVRHPETYRRIANLGVFGHIDQVAAGGQLAATGQAVAVDLGDHRLRGVREDRTAG